MDPGYRDRRAWSQSPGTRRPGRESLPGRRTDRAGSGLTERHADRRTREVVGVRPGAELVLERRAVQLTGVLDGEEERPALVGDQRAAGLGAARHRHELLDPTALSARQRHPEDAVVGPEDVAVGRDPEVALVVERHVVRAADRADA